MILGSFSFVFAVLFSFRGVDRPLSKQYTDFLRHSEGLSAEEKARAIQKIPKFDTSAVWHDPLTYAQYALLLLAIVSFYFAYRARRASSV